MRAYISILRPSNAVMSAIAVYIGAVVAGSLFMPAKEVLLAMLVVLIISGAGMVVNDIFDVQIDKVNKPKRPIPSGKISKFKAWFYAVALFAIGNFISFYFLSNMAFYVSIAASVLLIAYASFAKKVVMVGHIMISLLVAITFLYGGIIVGDITRLLPIASLAFLANMGREIYKTIDDVMGDKSGNVRTLAVRFGTLRTKMTANVFIIAAVICSFLPYLSHTFGTVYLFFVVVADIVFLSCVMAPTKYSSKLAKIAMMIALVAFLVGAYYARV